MRTVPVKYSGGPLPDGCEPTRTMSIVSLSRSRCATRRPAINIIASLTQRRYCPVTCIDIRNPRRFGLMRRDEAFARALRPWLGGDWFWNLCVGVSRLQQLAAGDQGAWRHCSPRILVVYRGCNPPRWRSSHALAENGSRRHYRRGCDLFGLHPADDPIHLSASARLQRVWQFLRAILICGGGLDPLFVLR